MGKNLAKSTTTIYFCDGGSCNKAGSEASTRAARAYLRNKGYWETTHTIKTRCNGRCEDAPTCIIQDGNYWYKKLTPEKIIPILKSHLEHNEPVTEHLIYQNGWEEIISENERKKIQAKPFELKQDKTLGECWLTKGFSSDQYLYPLFLHLLETQPNAEIQLANGITLPLTNLEKVVYEDKYTIELHFKDSKSVPFVIGIVPKTEPEKLATQKISSTEYFIKTNTLEKGIRLRDKVGNLVALLTFAPDNEKLWEYCTEIQLLGIENPINKTIDV